jgi:hypothetical protein
MYGLDIEKRILDKILKLITVICPDNYDSFIALSVNWYNNSLLPLLRQFFLIQNRINE